MKGRTVTFLSDPSAALLRIEDALDTDWPRLQRTLSD
jgi:hypothetical protein